MLMESGGFSAGVYYTDMPREARRGGGIVCNVRKGYCRLLYKDNIIFVLFSLNLCPKGSIVVILASVCRIFIRRIHLMNKSKNILNQQILFFTTIN